MDLKDRLKPIVDLTIIKIETMKIIPNCLLAFCIIFSTLMISCTKETTEEEQSDSAYRIVSTKGYNKNILTSETTYEYVENKISKISATHFGEYSEYFNDAQSIYTYPEKNKVFISTKEEGLELTREIEITLSNGKWVERLDFNP